MRIRLELASDSVRRAMECHDRLVAAAIVSLVISLQSGGLLLLANPVIGGGDARDADHYVRNARQILPEDVEGACPGYQRGVKAKGRDKLGCQAGTVIQTSHELAFGFSGGDVDWTSCDLPEYPESNHRVCYKTTVDLCDEGYRIYLHRRKLKAIMSEDNKFKCNESDRLTETGEDVLFRSPRYTCTKGHKKLDYRSYDFCLYNISLPNCESGRVQIETPEQDIPEVQERKDGVCQDYLQFYYNYNNSTSKTRAFCGSDFNVTIVADIPTTDFVAVFWTDFRANFRGFELLARCQHQEQDSSGDVPLIPY